MECGDEIAEAALPPSYRQAHHAGELDSRCFVRRDEGRDTRVGMPHGNPDRPETGTVSTPRIIGLLSNSAQLRRNNSSQELSWNLGLVAQLHLLLVESACPPLRCGCEQGLSFPSDELCSLSQTLALARRERRMVALLYIDLDGFKLINDSLWPLSRR